MLTDTSRGPFSIDATPYEVTDFWGQTKMLTLDALRDIAWALDCAENFMSDLSDEDDETQNHIEEMVENMRTARDLVASAIRFAELAT